MSIEEPTLALKPAHETRTALEPALFDVERVIVGQDGILERVAMRRIDLVHGEKPAR